MDSMIILYFIVWQLAEVAMDFPIEFPFECSELEGLHYEVEG